MQYAGSNQSQTQYLRMLKIKQYAYAVRKWRGGFTLNKVRCERNENVGLPATNTPYVVTISRTYKMKSVYGLNVVSSNRFRSYMMKESKYSKTLRHACGQTPEHTSQISVFNSALYLRLISLIHNLRSLVLYEGEKAHYFWITASRENRHQRCLLRIGYQAQTNLASVQPFEPREIGNTHNFDRIQAYLDRLFSNSF